MHRGTAAIFSFLIVLNSSMIVTSFDYVLM